MVWGRSRLCQKMGIGILVAAGIAALGGGAGPAWASFGVKSMEVRTIEAGGEATVQAGSHPYALTVTALFNRHPVSPEQKFGWGGAGLPDGDVRTFEATLPAGMTINLLGVAKCTEAELANSHCPATSQVGVVGIESGLPPINGNVEPLYNMVPSSPEVPGEFGFVVFAPGGLIVEHIVGKVNPGAGYALAGETSGILQLAALDGFSVTFWGDPSDPAHDSERHGPESEKCLVGCAVPRTDRPFVTMPTSCGSELTGLFRMDSWQEPESYVTGTSMPAPAMTGCEKLAFAPTIEVEPEATATDTPTGLSVRLSIPQPESVEGLAEANMKEAVVVLPPGLVVSPSAADGLEACSEAQIGLSSAVAPSCPNGSKIASVEARSPLLEHPLSGSVYLAQQGNLPGAGSNPFKSLIAMYLVVEGNGVTIKAPGEVRLNESTGQITARFGEDPLTGYFLPQVPYGELRLNFFGGPRAALATPSACGTYTTTTAMTPWSAPASGPPATPLSGFEINTGCAGRGFAPTASAGTTNSQAGGYSPIVATLTRQDSEQELSAVQIHTPPGLLGMLAKVPLCGEPQAAEGKCGAESQIGEGTALVGPGTDPFTVTGARVYLTGPYRGAPFGLSVVVPGRAGPFDLGEVVVRATINIDLNTSALTVTSDPLPRILKGIPLQVRSIAVDVSRPDFTFNPTNCERMSITATLQGAQGATTQESVPFQAKNCAALAFKPQFTVSTSGKTSKVQGASLDAKVVYPAGPQGSEANFSSAKVELPKQLPARLKTLQKACVAATFEANPAHCPTASVVGIAKVVTPLLPVTLTGPVYFVSHGGEAFPSLIVVLQGEGVRVDLTASTFISKRGITTSTFNGLPDVPFSSFELYLPQGPDSALAANGNLCKSKLVMPTVFTAQNGAEIHQSTRIALTGCPKARGARAKAGRARARRSSDAGRRHVGGRSR